MLQIHCFFNYPKIWQPIICRFACFVQVENLKLFCQFYKSKQFNISLILSFLIYVFCTSCGCEIVFVLICRTVTEQFQVSNLYKTCKSTKNHRQTLASLKIYGCVSCNFSCPNYLNSRHFIVVLTCNEYSRVHISSDTAFLKILKKPSIVQE